MYKMETTFINNNNNKGEYYEDCRICLVSNYELILVRQLLRIRKYWIVISF